MDEIKAKEDAWQRRNPQHPGAAIADACIGPEAVPHGGSASVSAAAELLGVDRKTLSRVIHGHCAISPDMAVRLESVGWGSAESWLWRQARYDLVQARKRLAAAA